MGPCDTIGSSYPTEAVKYFSYHTLNFQDLNWCLYILENVLSYMQFVFNIYNA